MIQTQSASLAVKIYSVLKAERSPTEGSVTILSWDKKGRMKRALKWGCGCVGLSIVSVLLPLLHFVLVPGFLIASPFVFFYFLNQESIILGGHGLCPECAKPVVIEKAKNQFPLEDVCLSCRNPFKVQKL